MQAVPECLPRTRSFRMAVNWRLLSQDSLNALRAFLPAHWSHANPIDILGDADPERYEKAVEIAIADPSSDGLLVVLAPQGMTNPAEVARRLVPYAKGHGKPVLASWMGGQTVAEGEALLNAAGIPTFAYPDTAARAFDYMWNYSSHLRGLYETPAITASATDSGARKKKACEIIEHALAAGRTLLTEVESKELLSAYGIPCVPDARGANGGRGGGLRGQGRIPGSPQGFFRNDYAQDGCRRREARTLRMPPRYEKRFET